MNEAQFLAKNEADWAMLQRLSDRADVSPANLTSGELKEFVRLYRRVSRDLALARTHSANVELIDHLNSLCARAYSQLYRTPRKPLRAALGAAVAVAAQTARRRAACVVASAAVFVAGGGFAAWALHNVPESRARLIPPMMEEVFEHWKSGAFEERSASTAIQMSGFYSSNNPFVAILTGAIAASTFGVGTAERLFSNGLILGALGSEMAGVGKLDHLIVSIAPHGVTEISGLVLSGAAGFAMGWALIAPGRRPRGEALREAGRDAIVLLATSVVLMFIAAPIEGFFSFNPSVPVWAKVALATGSAVGWTFFWTGYGREAEPPALNPSTRARASG